MEASALPAPAQLARSRPRISPPLLRLRSDEQLVALFRRGNEEAFGAIHDRYRARLFAYARQMLSGSRQDAEDALQDVFVRAYHTLRDSDREISLRAWLYRVAHNRCVDELRRPPPPSPEVLELVRPPQSDPLAEAERRESLRRLVADVRRLPEQQRSALLMRELNGLSYFEVGAALGVSAPAVKSLLVRARIELAQAGEARDAECPDIRAELALAHDEGSRASALARRHLRDCAPCCHYRADLKGVSRNFAALAPGLAPLAALANLFGVGAGGSGGAAAGSGAALGSGGSLAAGAAVTKVAAVVCVAVATAGGAVEVERSLSPSGVHHAAVRHHAVAKTDTPASFSAVGSTASVTGVRASWRTRAVAPAARSRRYGHPHHASHTASAPAAGAMSDPAVDPSATGRADPTPATDTPTAPTGSPTAGAPAPGAGDSAPAAGTPAVQSPDTGAASAPTAAPAAASGTP
ncbi:MAG: sigma-70 family RNA polymerase sigma factor [Solirubrobacteraceae bacterium]